MPTLSENKSISTRTTTNVPPLDSPFDKMPHRRSLDFRLQLMTAIDNAVKLEANSWLHAMPLWCLANIKTPFVLVQRKQGKVTLAHGPPLSFIRDLVSCFQTQKKHVDGNKITT